MYPYQMMPEMEKVVFLHQCCLRPWQYQSPYRRTKVSSIVLEEYVYQLRALAMPQRMDQTNAPGFFKLFGSITVKNNVEMFMAIKRNFQDEVEDQGCGWLAALHCL